MINNTILAKIMVTGFTEMSSKYYFLLIFLFFLFIEIICYFICKCFSKFSLFYHSNNVSSDLFSLASNYNCLKMRIDAIHSTIKKWTLYSIRCALNQGSTNYQKVIKVPFNLNSHFPLNLSSEF